MPASIVYVGGGDGDHETCGLDAVDKEVLDNTMLAAAALVCGVVSAVLLGPITIACFAAAIVALIPGGPR